MSKKHRCPDEEEEEQEHPIRIVKKHKSHVNSSLLDLLSPWFPEVLARLVAEFADDRLPCFEVGPCPASVLSQLQEMLIPPLDLVEDILKLGGRIAGGAVVAALSGMETHDVDVYVSSEETFVRLLRHLVQKIQPVAYKRLPSAVTMQWSDWTWPLQIIYTAYPDPRDLVLSFDFDYVQCIVFSDSESSEPLLGQTSWCETAIETKKIRYVTRCAAPPLRIQARLRKAYEKGMSLIQPFTVLGQLGMRPAHGPWHWDPKLSIDKKEWIHKTGRLDRDNWFPDETLHNAEQALVRMGPLVPLIRADYRQPEDVQEKDFERPTWEFVDLSTRPAPPEANDFPELAKARILMEKHLKMSDIFTIIEP